MSRAIDPTETLYVRKLPSGRWQASYLGPDLVRRTAPHIFDAKADPAKCAPNGGECVSQKAA